MKSSYYCQLFALAHSIVRPALSRRAPASTSAFLSAAPCSCVTPPRAAAVTIMTRTTRSSSRRSSASTKQGTSTASLPKKKASGPSRKGSKIKNSRIGSAASKATNSKAKATIPNDTSSSAVTTVTSQQEAPWYTFYTRGDPEYDAYMATEWGFEKPGDDRAHFEKISLEGAQSGLSWRTILRKRGAYRRTFGNFDPAVVARMTDGDVERIVHQEGDDPAETVVRHRGKIQSVINNAKCVLEIQKEQGSFADFLWSFVHRKPILNSAIRSVSEAPSTSPESEAMSKDLKKRGFRFVGPTTCYAMMQAMGMVIDHPVDTPEWKAARKRLQARQGGYQERK